MKVSLAKRAECVARIRAGQSTYAAEARRVAVNERSVRRWVEDAGGLPDPDKAPPLPGGGTGPETAEGPSTPELNPRLEEALRETGAAPAAPSPADAAAAARSEDVRLALETVKGVKAMLAYGAGLAYGIPADDPAISKASELIPPAEAAVVANGPYLADMIRRQVGGPYVLAAALALDAVVSWAAIRARAVKLHPPAPRAAAQPLETKAPAQAPAPPEGASL